MDIYYISEEKTNKKDAGSKARNDVDDILKSEGFYPIKMLNKNEKGKVKTFSLFYSFIKQRKFKENSVIITQYPIYDKSVFMRFYLKWMKEKKGVKQIALVHDLNSLRAQNKEKMLEEIKRLEIFDVIISHNSKMSKWLRENGVTSKIIDLEIFDYLIEDNKKEFKEKEENNYNLCFAGNLSKEKSGFIYKLDKRLNIDFYGPYYTGEDKARYKGCLKPEELPAVLNEDFGLIWDGESDEACVGEMGEYLKYNNPHKTSLYIASGLPIVIWDKAALADFVLENNIGITIGSLDELYEKLSNITKEEYKIMKNNVLKIREEIIKGAFTKKAIREALKVLK